MNFENKKKIQFENGCTFHIKDSLKHKLFWWPETLMTYHLDFSKDHVLVDGLALYDFKTKEQVPFQLSKIIKDNSGRIVSSDLSFLTDLGSGEERSFELIKAAPKKFEAPIKILKTENSLWIDNGVFSAQIPDSQIYPINIPGPIMQISTKGIKYGNSQIELGSLRILEIRTECHEFGNIFSEFIVKYVFDGGKTYEAILKFIKNMEFIEFTENIENIVESDDASFKIYWSGLAPTHRHAPNNPAYMEGNYETKYEDFNWCKMDEANVGGYNHPVGMWSNKEDGQIPFRLSLYEPQATLVKVNSAAFWNEISGQSIGAFISDESKWDNRRYDLFCSWDGFAVSFFYKNGLMWWKFPIINGTRTTAIAVYEHRKDKEYFDSVRPQQDLERKYLAGGTSANLHSSSYCMFLQNRYSLLSLNKIKDYILEYPESSKRSGIIFDECPYEDYESFEDYLMNYILVSKLPTHGQRENAGFNPVPFRRMTGFAAAYNRLKDKMPSENRGRIEAMLLLLTYLAASEHVVPLINMLGGPPNLQGDVRRTLGYIAILFPEHPEAENWKEIFAKFVETSLRLYTRPDLKGLRLEGGRWAENLGTYTWAFLIPALRTAMLLEKHGGQRNIFASKYSALLGKWLVHCMTAPFNGENEESVELMNDDGHHWGCFAEDMGSHRVYMPIGAHAARRTTPSSMRDFAKHLERYDPILAENINYVCSDLADDFESRKKEQVKGISDKNRLIKGTRPDFTTTAFTGFGIMLRNGEYTPSEASVFLQQIDEGPNYRWGTAGAGGNGNIYYYANGKAYSHNGKEDAGDRKINDCEVGCNFGVWKNNKYTSIGQNIITNGYHALGTFQYTSIESEKDSKSYSYPEYLERNVLLSGTDYISIYDKTGSPRIANRFTWSVLSFDKMPNIYMITEFDYTSKLTTGNKISSIDSVWYEGRGNCFAIVSHREDLHVDKRNYGAVVSSEYFKDTLFRSNYKLVGEFDGIYFEGTAGAIREYCTGDVDVALIHGHYISTKGISLRSENGKTGLSLSWTQAGEMKGFISSLLEDRIAVSYDGNKDVNLFINSALCEPDEDGMYKISSGEYTLELVKGNDRPIPAKPIITNIIQGNGSCEVIFNDAARADYYQIQISSDYCETWSTVSETKENSCRVEGMVNDTKYFVRVRGKNDKKCGEYSHEYPVYPSSEKPLSPEGLDVIIKGDDLHFSWGRVLGAKSYHLYRKDVNGTTQIIYSGEEASFTCKRAGNERISSYIVSAVNLCGEGERSKFEINDDPATLQNYKPLIDSYFNRNSLYGHHPFKLQNTHKYRDVPSSYPESIR